MDYEKLHKDTINNLQQMVSCGKITVETARSICADFVHESQDERMWKLIKRFAHYNIPNTVLNANYITRKQLENWLEKQSNHVDKVDQKLNILQNAFDKSKKDYTLEEKIKASDYAESILPTSIIYGESEEEYKLHTIIEAAFIAGQSEQEQLYIRFGEIPADEKSRIYQREIKVGTEKGVSVYPAFKTDKGDIVLGLSLPITRTTLYTQQGLIEYDDRPCYLVKGDYVGKDTDGQPLIRNVKIIEKIDKYRAKEEKKGLFALEAERYFSESKENKDEIIRKEIAEYFKHYSGGDSISIKFPEWIAWLEK